MKKIEGLNRKYTTNDVRVGVIDKIDDMRYGDSFKHYKDRFFLQTGADTIDEEKMRKLFANLRFINIVIELFVSFCPNLVLSPTKGKKAAKKTLLLKEVVNSIKWDTLIGQIYDLLESKGDVFFYIYFDENEGKKKEYLIPKIRQLEAENMTNIILDEANNPQSYIYKHKIYDEVINYKNGEVSKTNERTEILIFEKGACHRIVEQTYEEGKLILDEDGNIQATTKTIKNSDELKDVIPLIHIASNKRQEEKYSIIPAEEYIELCLRIDQISSDMRTTNRNQGFPKTMLLDCEVVGGDGQIGGFTMVKSNSSPDELANPVQGQIIDKQIKNGLNSLFSELTIVTDTLYDIVGITNPTLMKRVSSSDSSKMYNQVNMRMEQKIEGYIDNIIESFKSFFKVALLTNGLYEEKYDSGYSFEKPESIIKNSAYDELLIKQLSLNTGYTTLYELLKKKGLTDEEIDSHLESINSEKINGKNDITVSTKNKNEIADTTGGI